jgi:hypothetical protein
VHVLDMFPSKHQHSTSQGPLFKFATVPLMHHCPRPKPTFTLRFQFTGGAVIRRSLTKLGVYFLARTYIAALPVCLQQQAESTNYRAVLQRLLEAQQHVRSQRTWLLGTCQLTYIMQLLQLLLLTQSQRSLRVVSQLHPSSQRHRCQNRKVAAASTPRSMCQQ